MTISMKIRMMMVHSRNVSRYYDSKRSKGSFYSFGALLTVLGIVLQVSGIWIVFLLERIDFF